MSGCVLSVMEIYSEPIYISLLHSQNLWRSTWPINVVDECFWDSFWKAWCKRAIEDYIHTHLWISEHIDLLRNVLYDKQATIQKKTTNIHTALCGH